MKNVPTLELRKIKTFFPNHRICSIKVFLILINGIVLVNSCNLNKIKKKASILLGKPTECETIYTRFIRFFKMKGIEGFILGVLNLSLSMALPFVGCSEVYCIAIDRTNWKIGKVNINILYIGLVLGNGYFIPLFFSLLDKKGNSSQAERIDLFNQFKSVFNGFANFSFVVVGDREFIGEDWFYYMAKNSYEFVMRIRRKDYSNLLASQLNVTIERLNKRIDKKLEKYGYCVLPIEIQGVTLYYHVYQKRKGDRSYANEKDKYIRFISSSIDPQWVAEQYDKRWKIEVFFEDSKLKGFDLESIGFKEEAKIRLMVAICAVCYVLCLIQGDIAYAIKAARVKLDKATNKTYKRVSVFTKGYERLEQIIVNLVSLAELINSLISLNYSINYDAIRDFMYRPPCQI
jgi:hypothetical protein